MGRVRKTKSTCAWKGTKSGQCHRVKKLFPVFTKKLNEATKKRPQPRWYCAEHVFKVKEVNPWTGKPIAESSWITEHSYSATRAAESYLDELRYYSRLKKRRTQMKGSSKKGRSRSTRSTSRSS